MSSEDGASPGSDPQWVEEPIMAKETNSPPLGSCPESVAYADGLKPCMITANKYCRDGRCYFHHNNMCRVGRSNNGCSRDHLTAQR